MAKDLSHIETLGQVSAHTGPEEIDDCLKGCSLVLIPAGMPRKPGKCEHVGVCVRSVGWGVVTVEHRKGLKIYLIMNWENSLTPAPARANT